MDRPPPPFPLMTPELLRAARKTAAERGVPLLQQLGDQFGLSVAQTTIAVANLAAVRVVRAERMRTWSAAFDLLPYHEAARRQCVLFRNGHKLCLVVSDPFDRASHAWLEEKLSLPIDFRLAHPADVAAVLSRYEDGARAMDGALKSQSAHETGELHGEELSLKSISEDTSPVVRLVHSTLYDALKAGASDIHLETTPAGLAIKYRIDGVLVTVGADAGHRDCRAGDLAHQGHVRTRHRRAARAAGRPLQGAAARAAKSTSASPSCPASSARTPCCASSTSRA